MAGFAHATIESWGDLRPCPHAPFTAGNVLTQDFKSIWHSEAMEAWRGELLGQCDGCALAGECRGGCLAQAMWRGTAHDPLIPSARSTRTLPWDAP
jgi:radical SAM protein with 4Fe4S-binding SPASM domain